MTTDEIPRPRAESEERWSSKIGVILAVAGSAVGLGNFLRFPGQAVENGGGAFMIPYVIALVFLGIPIGWAEWTMARYGGHKGFHSSPAVLGAIGGGRTTRYLGVLGLLVPLVIYMYYVVIETWCMRYAWDYLTGGIQLGDDPSRFSEGAGDHFAAVSGVRGTGAHFLERLAPWILVTVVNVWFVGRGISKGIERVSRLGMPLMALCACIVLGRVLTLGTPDPNFPERNVLGGLGYMWNPNLSQLADFKTWLAAAAQVFFSLSVGFGVIINYASYLRRKDDVVLSGLTAASTNETFEVVFGGLITIPAAFLFLGASGAAGGTFGLGFQTLPVVFEHMGPSGRFFGFVWFLMLFLAALTSSLSMLQPVVAFVCEALGVSRARAVAFTSAPALLGSLWVLYQSEDLVALDTMDFWVGTLGIFLFATVQIVTFGWIFGVERGISEAHHGALIRIPRVYRYIMKYVAPTYLLVVLVGFCFQSLPGYVQAIFDNHVVAWTLAGLALVIAGLLLLTRQLEVRLRAAGLDVDGELDEVAPPRRTT